MLKVILSVGTLQLAAMLFMLLRTKGLALMLGPEQYGLMAALDRLLAVLAQTASISMPFAALRYLSPLWHENRAAYFELLRRMRTVLGTLVTLTLAVGVTLTWLRPGWLGSEVSGDQVLTTLAILTLPVIALTPFLQNAIASRFVYNRAMAFYVVHAAAVAVTGLAGVWLWGLRGMYGLYALLGGLLVFVVLRRVEGTVPASVQAGIAPLPGITRPETPVFGRGLAGYLPAPVWRLCLAFLAPAFLAPAVAYAVFYQVFVQLGDDMAGYMQAAIGLSLAVRGILGAANQVFLTPLVNRSGTPLERAHRAAEYQKTLFLLVGVVVPPVVLLASVAVSVLYSPQFLPAAAFVALFVGLEVLTLGVATYQAIIVALDHVVVYVVQNVLAQLTLFAIAMATIPELGVVGVAIAGFAAQLVVLIGTFGWLGYRHGVKVPPRLAALCTYVFVVLAASGVLAWKMPGLVPSVAVWKALFYVLATAMLFVFLDGDDWRRLRRLVKRHGDAGSIDATGGRNADGSPGERPGAPPQPGAGGRRG